MSVKLVNENMPRDIWVGDMIDGDIAIIVGCKIDFYIGRIIQRYENNIISIGMTHLNKWSNRPTLPDSFRVRLLKKGETLVIT